TRDNLTFVKRETADGAVTRVSVPSALLDKVRPAEGALAFLDTSLSPFDDLNAVKLELARGGEVFEAEKDEKKPAEWVLEPPRELRTASRAADAGQVDEVLRKLSGLSAKKWVARVSPKDLDRYGLKAPAVTAKVTVKKDGKTTTHTFAFGKDTDVEKDKPGVFARLDDKNLVFLVDPSVVKTLRDAELRDRTVLAFDADKVKEVKVVLRVPPQPLAVAAFKKESGKGWVDPELEKKEFKLDSAQVDQLVFDLARLKAEKFVQVKGKLDPKYKLTDKDAALKVELTVEGVKGAKTLTVGAPAGDKSGYYATSSDVPAGVVFVVPERTFAPVLRGLIHFSRDRPAAQ